jgi:hypothetical protein
MSYDYNGFVQSLAGMLVIPATNTDFLTNLPNVIDDAEQRIYRELDLLATIVRQTGAFTMNSRNFILPSGAGRFVVTESMSVIDLSGARRALIPASREYIDFVYGSDTPNTTPSYPEYYGMLTDQTVLVGPPPDSAYTVEVTGTIRPTPLSPTNTTTYLTNYLPDLFLAEAMIFGYGYMKDFGAIADDPQGSASWTKHYQDLWQSANTEEQRKRYASMVWNSKQPSPIATPPRAQ